MSYVIILTIKSINNIKKEKNMDKKSHLDNSPIQEIEIGETETPEKKKLPIIKWIIAILIVVLVIFGLLYGVSKMTKWNILGLEKSEWQAVFLSNGQVYFGHLSGENKKTVILKKIYYLQVTQSLQSEGTTNLQEQGQGELALVKLGNELHGPVDLMKINRDHILFIEDLKKDGKVVTAIEEDIKKQTSK